MAIESDSELGNNPSRRWGRRPGGRDRGIYQRKDRGGEFWIMYSDGGRLVRRRGGKTKTEAKQVLARCLAALAERRPDPLAPPPPCPTLAQCIQAFLAGAGAHKKSRYVDALWGRLWTSVLGERRADSITPADVERFVNLWATQVSAATVNRRLALLSRVFTIAIRDGHVLRNPVSIVGKLRENNERDRYLKEDEEIRLRAVLKPEAWDLVEIAMKTGLRQDEQFSLRPWDVDLAVGELRLPDTKPGKTRHLRINQDVRTLLARALARVPPGSQWVFLGAKGGRLNPDHFCKKVFNPALAAAGIEDFTWHDLRHTYASRLAMKGVDLYAIQRLLGHKTGRMTERYAHLSQDHLARAVELLNDPR